jgi:hypothetical protein
MTFRLTKVDKFKLIGLCIKSITAVLGGSLILVEGHPYATLIILAMGGVANEIVIFIEKKENENKNENTDNNIPTSNSN